MVTLTVNSTQAMTLQLAEKNGSLSLAVRNPLDLTAVDTDKISIKDFEPIPGDEYSKLQDALAARRAPHANEPTADGQSQPSHPSQTGYDTRAVRPGQDHAALTNARGEQFAEDKAPLPGRMLIGQKSVDAKKKIMVIRGAETEICVFDPNDSWWVLDSRTHSGTNGNTR